MFAQDAASKPYLRTHKRRRPKGRILGLSGLILVGLLALSTRLVYGDMPQRQGRVVVQPGETVWSIASRYAPGDPRPRVDAILRVNHLSTPLVRPGQSLLVPPG
jgi:nucleoid-associated protein YgaU